MSEAVSVDGQGVAPEEVHLSLRDRTIAHGDSVFEVLRAYGGRPFALEEHLGRLQRSAMIVGRVFPCSVGRLAAEVSETLARSGLAEAHIRILLTRGVGGDGLGLEGVRGGRRVVWVRPLPELSPTLYSRGVRALLTECTVRGVAADLARAKSGNYLARVIALSRARAARFDDALLVDDQQLVWEATAANVFALSGRRLLTPPLSGPILAGVTREKILDLAREHGLTAVEAPLSRSELMSADEVFLTSSIREVVPIVEVDEHVVGSGEPGRCARAMHDALRALAGAPPISR
jgi:branched-chain amino acid aminotransferase